MQKNPFQPHRNDVDGVQADIRSVPSSVDLCDTDQYVLQTRGDLGGAPFNGVSDCCH